MAYRPSMDRNKDGWACK
ncbi:excalibur calcium-binding domain-containing protein [Exiguobacterium alkaliphilum]